MEKLFIPYELALKLKELGFKFYPLGYYSLLEDNKIIESKFYASDDFLDAPLWEQAFDWFREKYRLNSFQDFYPTKENLNRAYFKIENHDSEKLYMDEAYLSGFFDNFEEARLGCLKKLIELCKK